MNQVSKIAEQFWIVMFVATLLYAIYMVLFETGFTAGAKYFVMPAIAISWWFIRKKMRIRIEKSMQDRNNKAK